MGRRRWVAADSFSRARKRPHARSPPAHQRPRMKALLCTRHGGPDDLEFTDIADPAPGPGEAVVCVRAAALNFFDTLIIAGKYQTKPAMPFSPAAEFAGTVESLGSGVTSLKAGDRVLGYIGYGA